MNTCHDGRGVRVDDDLPERIAGIDRFVVTGAFARAARCYEDHRLHLVERVDELAESLPSLARPGDTLLLKASRGVRLERTIPALESRYGGARV